MSRLLRSRRRYDHRIPEIVCETSNPAIFQHLRIPRSTTASWLSRVRPSVVSLDWNHDIASVLYENEKLKRRTERQTAIIRLLVVLLKLSGSVSMSSARLTRWPRPESCGLSTAAKTLFP